MAEYEELGYEVEFAEGEEEGGNFTLLEPGFYPFEVRSAKKARTNGNPPHKCVDFTLKVGVGPKSATVTDRIAMHSGMKWKMAQIYTSLGLRKHGEAFTFRAEDTVGQTGWVEIDHREYERDGETRRANNVTRYLDPSDAPADGQPLTKGSEESESDEW